jgi:hypothetical protein
MSDNKKKQRVYKSRSEIRKYSHAEVSELADKILTEAPALWSAWSKAERDESEEYEEVQSAIIDHIQRNTTLCSDGFEIIALMRSLRRELRIRNGLFVLD